MPLQINLVEAREEPQRLRGQLPAEELELGLTDELIHFRQPLTYDLEAEFLGDAVLVRGRATLPVDYECARCLKPFTGEVQLTEWSAHLPLTGPEKVSQVGDSVDLTPFLREDILLALPQHPVCGTECDGPKPAAPSDENKRGTGLADKNPGVWAELDKLKL
ncbi:MAG TPA: YceD family protein [Verrucomicrobiae bacterium]|jgi:uncharacterized protein